MILILRGVDTLAGAARALRAELALAFVVGLASGHAGVRGAAHDAVMPGGTVVGVGQAGDTSSRRHVAARQGIGAVGVGGAGRWARIHGRTCVGRLTPSVGNGRAPVRHWRGSVVGGVRRTCAGERHHQEHGREAVQAHGRKTNPGTRLLSQGTMYQTREGQGPRTGSIGSIADRVRWRRRLPARRGPRGIDHGVGEDGDAQARGLEVEHVELAVNNDVLAVVISAARSRRGCRPWTVPSHTAIPPIVCASSEGGVAAL